MPSMEGRAGLMIPARTALFYESRVVDGKRAE